MDIKSIIGKLTDKKSGTSGSSDEKSKKIKYIITALVVLGAIIVAIWGQKAAWVGDIIDDIKQVVEGKREVTDVVTENISVVSEKVLGGDSQESAPASITDLSQETSI